ncbi:MAG: hypothetical protein WCI18_08920 [Pseudomonadota bacterium]
MSPQLLKNQPNWQEIMARLGERLYQDFIQDDDHRSLRFDYAPNLEEYKNTSKLALALELCKYRDQALADYKGCFARELEGRLVKESQYFHKRFREATEYISQLVKEEYLNDEDNLTSTFKEKIQNEILVAKSHYESELLSCIQKERESHTQRLHSIELEAKKTRDEEHKFLETLFQAQLANAKKQLDLEFKKTHDEKVNLARVDLQNALLNQSQILDSLHQKELAAYKEELNQKLKQELASWLETKLDELNRSKEEAHQVKLTLLQENYLEEIDASKSKYLIQLDAWTAAIKTQVRAKAAKEQKLLMEKEAAQMLRDLAASVHHINLQANIHIDSLETKSRA